MVGGCVGLLFLKRRCVLSRSSHAPPVIQDAWEYVPQSSSSSCIVQVMVEACCIGFLLSLGTYDVEQREMFRSFWPESLGQNVVENVEWVGLLFRPSSEALE